MPPLTLLPKPANVVQVTTNQTELAFHAQPSAIIVKLTVSAQLAQILSEKSIKIVIAQLVSSMMEQLNAKLVMHFARPVLT